MILRWNTIWPWCHFTGNTLWYTGNSLNQPTEQPTNQSHVRRWERNEQTSKRTSNLSCTFKFHCCCWCCCCHSYSLGIFLLLCLLLFLNKFLARIKNKIEQTHDNRITNMKNPFNSIPFHVRLLCYVVVIIVVVDI